VNVPNHINDRFYAGSRTEAVRFVINDAVRVKSGPHAGRTGAVISIVSLDPEATFLVEPGEAPYDDLQIARSALELIE
jgi:hypothetical protein